MLVAPCAIVPAQPFLLPENAPPRPSSVSTFPQANDGASEHESTTPRGRNSYHPNHARARFPLPEKGRPALLVVTQVSGSRASFAAAKYRIMMDKWLVGVLWPAQTLRVSATVVHSSFHCLWQPETDFIFPEDPGPTYRPQLHLSPVLSLLSFFSTQSNSKPPNLFERERGYALAPAKKTVTRPRARSESRVRVAASRVTIHIISKSCLKDQSDLVLTYLVST